MRKFLTIFYDRKNVFGTKKNLQTLQNTIIKNIVFRSKTIFFFLAAATDRIPLGCQKSVDASSRDRIIFFYFKREKNNSYKKSSAPAGYSNTFRRVCY